MTGKLKLTICVERKYDAASGAAELDGGGQEPCRIAHTAVFRLPHK